MLIKTVFGALASVLFPGPCRICSDTLTNASRVPICELCLDGFERILEPMCACCGRPLAQPPAQPIRPAPLIRPAEQLCHLCRAQFYAFDRARSFAVYDDALSEAMMLLKYDEVTRLGHWFAAKLAEMVASAGEDWRVDVIVPVPLHIERQRERGYNQAELIARPLARRLHATLAAHLLVRTKPRPARLVLSRTEHWESVRGAYATGPSAQVDNLRILLVDDVMTTGATLDACARALKKAGAASVLGLTVGRVRSGTPALAARGSKRRHGSKEPQGRGAHQIQSSERDSRRKRVSQP